MINLIIDIGNSRTKVALFRNGKLEKSFPVEYFSFEKFLEIKADYPEIKNAIISTVKEKPDLLIEKMAEKLETIVFLDHNTKIPIENCYKTPETLGKDRLAAVVGANYINPERDILVIDAGTAITYDFITKEKKYKGGFITPGLSMRFKALHHFTSKLPLLNSNEPGEYYGDDTNSSIIGGIQLGLEGEINSIFKHFSAFSENLLIFLTGGDTKYFEKLLKSYNFVSLEITLIGLNRILEYNHIN